MKILIVDDDKMILQTVSHNLKIAGYETSIAEDSLKALGIIQNEKIDLILTDLMMPNMSGLGLLNLLKQFYFNSIPVIIISSLDKGALIIRSLGLGASEFITKPIDFSKLLSIVKKYEKK